MKVINDEGQILDSEATIETIDSVTGIVLHSRSGGSTTARARNTDYNEGLETILRRIQQSGAPSVRLSIVSSNALQLWTKEERYLKIDGDIDLVLSGRDIHELRVSVSRAQQAKKPNSKSKGGNPTKKLLIEIPSIKEGFKSFIIGNREEQIFSETELENQGEDSTPSSQIDAREKAIRAITIRRGQSSFRKKLIKAYEGKCAISGSCVTEILEAAHVIPYNGPETNQPSNGILLRADLHTLFDLGLIGIDENLRIVVSKSIRDSEYSKFHDTILNQPNTPNHRLSKQALKQRPIPA
ncbi:HNH endonuclease [Pelagicoccus enzymogenes]|uniref:HNH endonuclease n=1 Tax=Pelagicoccus enzymogenes TaxID=2773457 RepID=UPI00280F39E1|nr:HNH endonuclease [Pelagicoccus enzymogenes]MDQ8201214.1 HNH endonuclease [Pelagicoccus enzymogenes]